jgi:hypothetical protein
MKAPGVFFRCRTFQLWRKRKPTQSRNETGTLLVLRRFFDSGEVYEVAVGLSSHRHSIQYNIGLLIQARSTTAQIPIPPIKKEEYRETGLGTENTAPIAMVDRMAGWLKIAAEGCVSQTHQAIATSIQTHSYLALNWQCGQIERQLTCRDRRFPTPAQRQNASRDRRAVMKLSRGGGSAGPVRQDTSTRFAQWKKSPNTVLTRARAHSRNGGENGASVTTTHLFWPNQRRKPDASLPISLRNLTLSAEAVAPQLTVPTAVSDRVSVLKQTLAAQTANRLHPPS